MFWAPLIAAVKAAAAAAAKAAASAAAKAAAVGAKAIATGGSKALGLAGKAAGKIGSQALEFGKGALQMKPTANAAGMSNVLVKPGMSRAIGMQTGKALGNMVQQKMAGGNEVAFNPVQFGESIETVNQAPNQSLLGKVMGQIGGLMQNPLESKSPQQQNTEFSGTTPTQMNYDTTVAPVFGKTQSGVTSAPLSNLSQYDIEYLRRMYGR